MARHDLPPKIKAHEIGKAQDQYLLFKNRQELDQSFKSEGILERKRKSSPKSPIFAQNDIESNDIPLDVGQSLELPYGIPDIELGQTEEPLWNELPYRKK